MGGGPPRAPHERVTARVARAERDAEAFRLSISGHTYDQIAQCLAYDAVDRPYGFRSRQAVHAALKRILDRRLKELDRAVDERRAREDALLDEALQVATEIMHRRHLAVGNGKVVQKYNEQTGEYEDVYDDAVNLAAADRLIKISESRRKLHGTDAPAKQEISGQSTVQYVISLNPDEMDQL